jgi:hypothetical protein
MISDPGDMSTEIKTATEMFLERRLLVKTVEIKIKLLAATHWPCYRNDEPARDPFKINALKNWSRNRNRVQGVLAGLNFEYILLEIHNKYVISYRYFVHFDSRK